MKTDISDEFNILVLDRMFSLIFNEIQYRQRIAVGPRKTKLIIYSGDSNRHHLPHVHVKYPKGDFVISIQDCNLDSLYCFCYN